MGAKPNGREASKGDYAVYRRRNEGVVGAAGVDAGAVYDVWPVCLGHVYANA